jgi:hypothetical protein
MILTLQQVRICPGVNEIAFDISLITQIWKEKSRWDYIRQRRDAVPFDRYVCRFLNQETGKQAAVYRPERHSPVAWIPNARLRVNSWRDLCTMQ